MDNNEQQNIDQTPEDDNQGQYPQTETADGMGEQYDDTQGYQESPGEDMNTD